LDENIENQYIAILKEELVPALGCTEPIAIAYAAAKARDVLGKFPSRLLVECSGNIIKNVKGVIVPTTCDLKGVDTSAILGAVGGVAEKKLEVLSEIRPEHLKITQELLGTDFCEVRLLENVPNLLIIITAYHGDESAVVEIKDAHTNINRIKKNGETIFQVKEGTKAEDAKHTNYDLLNLRDIYEFSNSGDISSVIATLKHQEECNLSIAKEGLTRPHGVGATLLRHYGDDIKTRARALAAAGSDARMSGCVLPVVINSGSGNQGITVCLPVLAYADYLKVSEKKKYSALALSNLVSIHIKQGIGKLSAFCGAVSAACGSGAAITYLCDGDLETISKTISNTLANISGIVCDGAKPSCAAKIASAVDAAILGHCMAMDGKSFDAGEGIIMEDVEDTISSTARVGREGMRSTDIEILKIMIGK
jgi:L-cysteine desulfidase